MQPSPLSNSRISHSLVAQFCPILCDPMDCSPPGSSVHGISQARILEWVAISFSRGSSQSWNGTHISCIGRQIPTEPPGKPILVPSYCLLNRSRASLVAQTVKNLPTMRETWVRSLGWEDLLEEGMATHSNIYSCLENPHGQRSLAGYSP